MDFIDKKTEVESKEEVQEKEEKALPPLVPAGNSTGATAAASSPKDAQAKEAEPSAEEKEVEKITSNMKSMSAPSQTKLRVIEHDSHLTSSTTFNDPALPIPDRIRQAILLKMGFERPSQIQAHSLPIVLRGNNLIAQAQSGSGKTVTFSIAMLSAIDTSKPVLQAVCLAPGRELAVQIVRDAIRPLSSYMPDLIIEEALQGSDNARINRRSNAHIIVGTTGKVLNWVKSKYINLDHVRVFVVDEADKMIEQTNESRSLGKDTIDIRKKLPPSCQVLFFSATYTPEMLDYARHIVERAYVIKLASSEELVLDVIMQVYIRSNTVPGGKLALLKDIYSVLSIKQSIVFIEQKKDADEVSRMMIEAGLNVSTLHSSLSGVDRDTVMNNFIEGKSKVLITTNALARGVDIPAVAVVVNYDMPVVRMGAGFAPDYVNYIHRIGRTGRFGRAGTAINFVDNDTDMRILRTIEQYYSPNKPMLKEWPANDIDGLAKAHNDRSMGGEEIVEN